MFFFSFVQPNRTREPLFVVSGNGFPHSRFESLFPINSMYKICYFIMIATSSTLSSNVILQYITQNGVLYLYYFVSSVQYYCVYTSLELVCFGLVQLKNSILY